MAKQKIPYLARGTLEALQNALDDGIFKDLDRAIYCYITAEEKAGCMAFVDPEKNIHVLYGANEPQVNRYNSIQDITNPEVNQLFLVGNTIYTYDGENFHPSYENIDDTIDSFGERLTTLENTVASYDQTIAELQEELEVIPELEDTVTANTNNIAALQQDKADKATTLAGYGINDAYTKDEIDALVDMPVDPDTGQTMNVTTYVTDSISDAMELIIH